MNHYESTIFFRENTIHPLSLSRIRNLPPKFTMNPREEYKFTIFFAKSLWIHYLPRINLGFMIFFAKSLWIHYLCCEIILNSLLRMQIHRFFCEFTIFYIFSLLSSLSSSPTDYVSTFISVESLSLSRIDYEFTIFTRFHHRFPECTLNSLSISRFFYEFTICFTKWL